MFQSLHHLQARPSNSRHKLSVHHQGHIHRHKATQLQGLHQQSQARFFRLLRFESQKWEGQQQFQVAWMIQLQHLEHKL